MDSKLVVVPFQKQHFDAVKHLPQYSHITEDVLHNHETCKHSFTIMDVNGRVLAMAGIVKMWERVGEAWAVFAPKITEHFLAIHKIVRSYLLDCEFLRVQMTVDCRFKAGHRWACLLGFKLEAERMKNYLPGGVDAAMYSLVRG